LPLSAPSFHPKSIQSICFFAAINCTPEITGYQGMPRLAKDLFHLCMASNTFCLHRSAHCAGWRRVFWEDHAEQDKSDVISGTIILGANVVSAGKDVGLDVFRNVEPAQRYGNLLIFRGKFHLPKQRTWRLYLRGITAVYSPGADLQKAERLFEESLQWNTEFYPSAIELGNLRAGRGARDEAIEAFQLAKAHAPEREVIGAQATEEIELLRTQNPRYVKPMRDPILE
jgi:hypothetical protein